MKRSAILGIAIFSMITVGLAAELSHHDLMVRGGALYVAMRNDIAGGNLEGAQMKARELAEVANEIQLFWTEQNGAWQVDDGVTWAGEAQQKSNELVKVLEAGDLETAGEALQQTGQACGACHQKYRPPRREPG